MGKVYNAPRRLKRRREAALERRQADVTHWLVASTSESINEGKLARAVADCENLKRKLSTYYADE